MDNGAARGGDRFSEQEIQQSNLITLLQEKDTTPSIRPEAAAREKALIVEILACNAKVQDRVMPWRAAIASLLDSASATKRVAQTYWDSKQASYARSCDRRSASLKKACSSFDYLAGVPPAANPDTLCGHMRKGVRETRLIQPYDRALPSFTAYIARSVRCNAADKESGGCPNEKNPMLASTSKPAPCISLLIASDR